MLIENTLVNANNMNLPSNVISSSDFPAKCLVTPESIAIRSLAIFAFSRVLLGSRLCSLCTFTKWPRRSASRSVLLSSSKSNLLNVVQYFLNLVRRTRLGLFYPASRVSSLMQFVALMGFKAPNLAERYRFFFSALMTKVL